MAGATRRTLDDYAFARRIDLKAHMSARQYARLVDEWIEAIGLRPQDHVQILLGHTKIEDAIRYLGVDIEDALELAEGTRSNFSHAEATFARHF